jgi:hypothetical protein
VTTCIFTESVLLETSAIFSHGLLGQQSRQAGILIVIGPLFKTPGILCGPDLVKLLILSNMFCSFVIQKTILNKYMSEVLCRTFFCMFKINLPYTNYIE